MELFRDEPLGAVACAGQSENGLTEILILPWGTVESRRGTFIVDEDAAKSVIESFGRHGV